MPELIDAPHKVPFEQYNLHAYRFEKSDRHLLVIAAAFIMAALLFVAVQGWSENRAGNAMFVPLSFMPETATRAIDVLTSLVVVVALMERAVEVFISGSRSITRKLAVRHIDGLRVALGPDPADATKHLVPEPGKRENLEDRLAEAEEGLTSYRTGTKIRSQSFSLIIGTLIALAGVRVISPLLDVPYGSLSNVQWLALQVVDIVGTAGVIAGGSGGLHRLISNLGEHTESAEASSAERATRPV